MEVVQTFYGPNDMLGGMPPDYPCPHDDSQGALRFAKNVSQTLQKYCVHNKEVHVEFDGARISFNRVKAFFNCLK